MNYAISDIHGCFDEFMEMLEKIKFSEKDTLYVLGDVFDRGPEPIKTLKYIMKHKNIKMLLGNHEAMMMDALEIGLKSDKELWLQNGGFSTLADLHDLKEEEIKEILTFLHSLPLYFIVNNMLLVHAGINSFKVDPKKTLEENLKKQTAEDLLWVRRNFIVWPTGLKNKVIFGHTPISIMRTGKAFIWFDEKDEDKIGIDCGLVFGGKLGCLNLDNMEEYYVDKH